MVQIDNGILLSHKKAWNLTICYNMDGPRGHYAKLNKSGRETQILYDFTYMQNIKQNTINKQIKQKYSHKYIEYPDVCQTGTGLGG